ncbi:MAG: HlyC/CorC family transporter [Ruminococcaceae bacterium]|nr:HlyC/CorC family transporter [Oscillospiraceae bacterium]
MGDDGSIPLQLTIIVLLTLLNAFFAASEIAIISVNDARIEKLAQEGNKKAKKLLSFLTNSGKMLSTIQVGVTFSGFLASAVASDSFADRIVNFTTVNFSWAENHPDLIRTISMALITILLSYFTLVFGELVPKRIAMKKSEKLALYAAGALKFTSKLFAPFVALLTFSVNVVLRLFRINPDEEEEEVTEEEILLMVNEGQEQGVLEDNETEMINNVLEFNDLTAAEAMTHRTAITALPWDATYEEVFDVACNEKYSRIPVYEGSIDDIKGIIHIKDLLNVRSKENFNIGKIIRPVPYVAGTQNLDEVFDILNKSNSHMAVVVDEYGGTEGIITMEDILEELVGNIRDEYDEAEENEHPVVKISEDEFIITGLAELDEVAENLGIDLPVDEYETASGFAIGMLEEIPDEGSFPEFEYGNYTFKVLSNTEKLISSLKATRNPDKEIIEDEEEA